MKKNMKFERRHNGFTIVELVVVIAIVAILAAVLIPTLSHMIERANVTADIQTVKNLNTALKMDIAGHPTLHDALAAAKRSGLNESSVTDNRSKKHFIAWDRANDRFVLVEKEEDADGANAYIFPTASGEETGKIAKEKMYNFFVIYDKMPDEQTYGIYLAASANVPMAEVTTGFDAGDNFYLKNLTYKSNGPARDDILIRTNGGCDCIYNGYVNENNAADGDTITHYGEAGTQTIFCADNSFHEKGAATKSVVTKGHYVLENGSIVANIEASASAGDVTIDLERGSVQGNVENKNENTENSVTINGRTGATTVNLVANTKNGKSLKIHFENPPLYADTTDCGEAEDVIYITGVGAEKRKIPSYEEVGDKKASCISVAGYSLKVYSNCNAYTYNETFTTENNELNEKTYTVITNTAGEAIQVNSTAGHNHTYGEPAWTWDGFEKAEAKYVCAADDCQHTVIVYVPDTKTGWSIQRAKTKDPTCTEEGEWTYTASINFRGDDQIDKSECKQKGVVPPTGHSYGDWTVTTAPTCTEKGIETRVCANDASHTETREVAALGHTPVSDAAVAATCTETGLTEGSHCSVCNEVLVAQEIVDALGHEFGEDGKCTRDGCDVYNITVKFPNTDRYLYRVGNQNDFAASLVFGGDINEIVFNSITKGVTGTYNNGKLKFEGTGIIKLTANNIAEVYLEVVDAINATAAAHATANNVVLLQDISVSGGSSIKVENGYAFYGNGFTVTCTGKGNRNLYDGMSEGFIHVNNGTLDNVKAVAAIFPRAYMYTGPTIYDHYLSEPENEEGSRHYNYQLSNVDVSGTSIISNCYFYGARNNIIVGSGNVNINNTTCSCGSLSNISINSSSAYTISLKNVTTLQYLNCAKFNDTEENVKGLGILVSSSSNEAPNLKIEGEFCQYNWVGEDENITHSKVAKQLIDNAFQLNDGKYVHTSTAGKKYVNTGIIFFEGANASNLQDTSSNADNYALSSIDYFSYSGYVYSLADNQGTVDLKDELYKFDGSNNGAYIPVLKIVELPTSQPETNEFCWNDNKTIRIQFEKGKTFTFDSELYFEFARYTNSDASVKIECDGAQVQGKKVVFSTAGNYVIKVVVAEEKLYDYNGVETSENLSYVLTIPVDVKTPDAARKDAEIIVDTNVNRQGVIINFSGDRYFWFDIFDGLKIIDYDEAGNEIVVLDGSSNSSKKDFIKKIAKINPTGNLIEGGDYNTEITIQIQMVDGRELCMKIKRVACSNSPGKTYGVSLNTDSNSLYYCTNTAANIKKISFEADKWFCSYKIFDYKFTGNSGKPIINNYAHYLATGSYDGVYTSPKTGSKPSTSFTGTKTLIYNANGGQVSADTNYTQTSPAKLPVALRDGYAFKGWNTELNGSGTSYKAGDSYTFSATTTLYAQWGIPSIVTFNANGGSCDIASAKYTGQNIILPNATNGSFSFLGWFDAEEGGTLIGAAGGSYEPEKDITLYAHWTDNAVVTFDANGGICNTVTLIYDKNTPITLPAATKTGYHFDGWFTAANGGTKVGAEGNSYSPDATMTVYAHWTIQTFTITIKSGGNGSVSQASIANVPYGTSITVSDATITINGTKVTANADSNYTFDKWDVSNGENITGPKTITATFTKTGCFAAGTMITLADGTQKPIEEVTINDQLLAWDFVSGQYVATNVFCVTNHGDGVYPVTHLQFSDGSEIALISEHGMFDLDAKRFVNVTNENAAEFVGHKFVKQGEAGTFTQVELISAETKMEETTAYSIISVEHLDAIANGFWTLDPSIYFLLPFEIDEDLKYDAEKMQADVETYGLLEYEEFKPFAPHMTETQFYAGSGIYIKIALGKGIITMDEIAEFAMRLLADQEYLV